MGEVHGSDVWLVERCVGAILAEAEHEIRADDAAGHVTGDHEREAAEHFALGQVRGVREELPDAVGELLVIGHLQ